MAECACPACVECCTRRPGWFKPGEAKKAAEYLGMTLEDFFQKYLVIEFWTEDSGDINALMPANPPATKPGTYASWASAFSEERCIFLNEKDRCVIHPFKPFECAHAMGCDLEQESVHEEVAMTWDKPEHQEQIEKLREKIT